MKTPRRSTKPADVLKQARTAMGAKRVYAKPVASDGVTVIPAARVLGGAGGGNGGPQGAGQGEGGGFGVMARPVGAFVIKGGTVRWKPAVDLLPLLGLGLLLLLAARSIIKLLTQP
jgi:uncharacterized spore protein YtfJ